MNRSCTMRRFGLLLLLAASVVPASAAKDSPLKKVNVEQLERTLAARHGKPNANAARELSALELTERLSAERRARLQAGLQDVGARQALIALADLSEFLPLPASEIPATAPPDSDTQNSLLALAAESVGRAIPRLPNFFATRDTILFAEDLADPSRSPSSAAQSRPIHAVDSSNATVLYRRGKEVAESRDAMNQHSARLGQELTIEGVFGPVLELVVADVLKSGWTWSHWERGAGGPLAFFSYAVPLRKSHYKVEIPGDQTGIYPLTGYHGEIAVDPANGNILRLTMLADLTPTGPIARADVLVEYGPVAIGGTTYLCPVRSVAVSLARPVDALRDLYGFRRADVEPMELELSDVVFRQYHLFRSEARIVTGVGGDGGQTPAPAAPDGTPPEAPAH